MDPVSSTPASTDTSTGSDSGPSGSESSSASTEPTQALPTGSGAANDNNESGESNPEAEKKKTAAEKRKLKRLGKEVELDLDDIVRLASDDGEHEVTASGQLLKLKYPELIRYAQLGHGAHAKMQEAAEAQKRLADQMTYAKGNIPWFLENHLGVEDHEQWAAQVVKARLQRERELNALLESNPSEYHSRVQADAQKRLEQKQAFEKHQREQREQAAKAAEQRKEFEANASKALQAVGLPLNPMVQWLAGQIYRQYAQVGHQLTPEQMADLTKAEYHKHIYGWIDSMDEDSLVSWLGDDRRKKLRDIELKKLNGGQKKPEAKAEGNGQSRPKAKADKDENAPTTREWLRKFQ